MRWIMLLAMCLMLGGCANFMREESTVIWDRIEGSDEMKLESLTVEGAQARVNLRYVCERRQFAVTNIYETSWRGVDELYEIPVGLVALIPGVVWYLVTEVATGGAIDDDNSTGPLDWATAGLNPVLPVQNGMFLDRYSIREKSGSRRAQEGSKAEPYDAAVWIQSGELEVRFADRMGNTGEWAELKVGEELEIRINLLEAAWAIPSADATKVELRGTVKPSRDLRAVQKTVSFTIAPDLAKRLFEAQGAVAAWRNNSRLAEREGALQKLTEMGFATEAAAMANSEKK